MHIDVHELDVFVLWGSAITFLAILAVRVSSRTRLPSLLLYLLMGVAIGEAGFGIHINRHIVHQGARRAGFQEEFVGAAPGHRGRIPDAYFSAGVNGCQEARR